MQFEGGGLKIPRKCPLSDKIWVLVNVWFFSISIQKILQKDKKTFRNPLPYQSSFIGHKNHKNIYLHKFTEWNQTLKKKRLKNKFEGKDCKKAVIRSE